MQKTRKTHGGATGIARDFTDDLLIRGHDDPHHVADRINIMGQP
jgi:hypothetical protein